MFRNSCFVRSVAGLRIYATWYRFIPRQSRALTEKTSVLLLSWHNNCMHALSNFVATAHSSLRRRLRANLYNGPPLSPLKLSLGMGRSGPHQIRGSTQTASRSVQPFLQGSLLWQTDWLADHATGSVTIGRIYVRSTAMRPNSDNDDDDGVGTKCDLKLRLCSSIQQSFSLPC